MHFYFLDPVLVNPVRNWIVSQKLKEKLFVNCAQKAAVNKSNRISAAVSGGSFEPM